MKWSLQILRPLDKATDLRHLLANQMTTSSLLGISLPLSGRRPQFLVLPRLLLVERLPRFSEVTLMEMASHEHLLRSQTLLALPPPLWLAVPPHQQHCGRVPQHPLDHEKQTFWGPKRQSLVRRRLPETSLISMPPSGRRRKKPRGLRN